MSTEQLYELFKTHPVVTTDSRKCPQGSIFFALKGESFDGNQFAAKALEQGCALAVVDDDAVAADDRYIVVPDVLTALQDLAHYHREQLAGKTIIQITGTNGKTTTKELVSTVLAEAGPVQFTQGNLNNHIGVPLTLLTLADDNGFGVIETGANHPGEIAFLSKIVDADMGLISNVGRAHLEGFGSFEGVKRTKGELYDYLREHQKTGIFLNASDPDLCGMAQGLNAVKYGLSEADNTDVWGEVIECNPFVLFKYRTREIGWQSVQTHLIGAYNINNLLAAVAVGLHFGVSAERINSALANYTPSNNRSEFRDTGRNHLIIDAYNANPSSMAAALRNFAEIKAEKKMVILGEMRELGAESKQEHRKVLELLEQLLPDCEKWLVGKNFTDETPAGTRCFANVEEVKQAVASLCGYTILIKGSNSTKLYQLPECL